VWWQEHPAKKKERAPAGTTCKNEVNEVNPSST
jgi:hypothetical protein